MADHRLPWSPSFTPPCLDGRSLSHLLTALLAVNVDYLRDTPQTPSIYESGVRYVPEPLGKESWLSIPWVRIQGHSVCHSLAAWRCAELQVKGENARLAWSKEPKRVPSDPDLFHVQIQRAPTWKFPQGSFECPSWILGMKAHPDWIKRFGPMHRVAPAVGVTVHLI